jgi:hypothetical protein
MRGSIYIFILRDRVSLLLNVLRFFGLFLQSVKPTYINYIQNVCVGLLLPIVPLCDSVIHP